MSETRGRFFLVSFVNDRVITLAATHVHTHIITKSEQLLPVVKTENPATVRNNGCRRTGLIMTILHLFRWFSLSDYIYLFVYFYVYIVLFLLDRSNTKLEKSSVLNIFYE